MTEPQERPIRLFDKAIKQRRQENDGLAYLSDWQVHSAHLTAGAISSLTFGYPDVGPIFVPMPTGSGKTTGAIWGMVKAAQEYPDQRLCFMAKYTEAVEEVHSALAAELGEDVVGHYHSEAFVNKDQELAKRIIVVTHNFVEYNKGKLDDRDLFVVDEAIYATGEASLRLQDFTEARSWATNHNIMPEAFTKLTDLAMSLDQKLRADGKKYIAAPYVTDRPWAREIAFDLKLSDHSQTISDNGRLVAVQRFCEALLEGLVFLSEGKKSKDLMVTGGFRSAGVMNDAIASGKTDLIGMGRPFIADPSFATKLLAGEIEKVPAVEQDFPPADTLPRGAVLNWFCAQIVLAGRTGAPDLEMSVVDGHESYLKQIKLATDQLLTARRE